MAVMSMTCRAERPAGLISSWWGVQDRHPLPFLQPLLQVNKSSSNASNVLACSQIAGDLHFLFKDTQQAQSLIAHLRYFGFCTAIFAIAHPLIQEAALHSPLIPICRPFTRGSPAPQSPHHCHRGGRQCLGRRCLAQTAIPGGTPPAVAPSGCTCHVY